jgi:hypothetical protein
MSELQQQLASSAEGVRVFDQGEFVEWHKSELGRSLIWSSALRLDELLSVVETTIGPADDEHRGLVDFEEHATEPTTAAAARALALSNPEQVTFLRLEFSNGIALVWTPKPVSEAIERKSGFAEASVFFTPSTTEAAELTMSRTATERLGSLAAMIVRSIAT